MIDHGSLPAARVPWPRAGRSESALLGLIAADVTAGLAHVEISADAVDDDDPVRGAFQSRLRSLRDAVAALQRAARRP